MSLYIEAGRILNMIENKKGGLKNLVYNCKYKNKKKLNALLSETIKYSTILKEIIKKCPTLKKEKSLKDGSLLTVVLYEFLFGSSDQLPQNLLAVLNKSSSALNVQLNFLKSSKKLNENNELVVQEDEKTKIKLPRYVRVNTLQATTADVVEHFQKDGFVHVKHICRDYDEFLTEVGKLKAKEFMTDYTLKDLLVFHPGTSFFGHMLYDRGDIILQDKASCLAASALAPPPGSKVIDSCAAPGNKTSYLAAIMENKGKIHAFDRDAHRFSTMQTMLLKAGVLCAVCKNLDFLTVNRKGRNANDAGCGSSYDDVEFMLVDPSCSGSGILDRYDVDDDSNDVTTSSSKSKLLIGRLKSLSNFQSMLLNHAMRNFPSVQRLVYSTCSIHREENEDVVLDALQRNKHFRLVRIFPEITSRGIPKNISDDNTAGCGSGGGDNDDKNMEVDDDNDEAVRESERRKKEKESEMDKISNSTMTKDDGDDSDGCDLTKCVRLNPSKDLTNGFFVACFEMKAGVTVADVDGCGGACPRQQLQSQKRQQLLDKEHKMKEHQKQQHNNHQQQQKQNMQQKQKNKNVQLQPANQQQQNKNIQQQQQTNMASDKHRSETCQRQLNDESNQNGGDVSKEIKMTKKNKKDKMKLANSQDVKKEKIGDELNGTFNEARQGKRKFIDEDDDDDDDDASGGCGGNKKLNFSPINDENKTDVASIRSKENSQKSSARERKLLKKRSRPKHKKPIIYVPKRQNKPAKAS